MYGFNASISCRCSPLSDLIMFDFSVFFDSLVKAGLGRWQEPLQSALDRSIKKPDGNLKNWISALSLMPELGRGNVILNLPEVTVHGLKQPDSDELNNLKDALLQLKPWRKGPFKICDITIDSEWRSNLKWERVVSGITSLEKRKVLDIGCGNGYYMLRMAEQKPEMVLGVDPSNLFLAQFNAATKYSPPLPVFLLPIGFEDLPESMEAFDTVFSMGVFYHRRSPFDFLRSLKFLLRQGGELVLETMIIEGDKNQILVPPERYARMNNVWFIPSVEAMTLWLKKAGFVNVKVLDVCPTTIFEQRQTDWMSYESLAHSLDPDNNNLTVEGLPAPIRAVFTCNRP